MAAGTQRLDRFIAKKLAIGRKETRLMVAQKRLFIDGQLATGAEQIIDRFSIIELDGKTLQHNRPQYIMLNKPAGVVSATIDAKHKTVIDLLESDNKQQLHIAGRLDFNSTGLLLLTNDSRWSERLMQPDKKISKHYHVTVNQKLNNASKKIFADGIYFAYEDITTEPAQLNILSDFTAEVVLTEGKYHQIKRMFGHVSNKVTGLHRYQVGHIKLDKTLEPGQSRALRAEEIDLSLNHQAIGIRN